MTTRRPPSPISLRRTWGGWRGTADLGPHVALPLHLRGGVLRPCPRAVASARALPERAQSLLDGAASLLHDELRVWALDGQPLAPRLSQPTDVWRHATPVHVRLGHQGGRDTAEVGLRVSWDEEHTWAARYVDWRPVALSGSVVGAH